METGWAEEGRLLVPSGVKVLEPEVRYQGWQNDGQRRCKAFEDVVGILDDRRYDQTPQRLEKQQTHRRRWTKAPPVLGPQNSLRHSEAWKESWETRQRLAAEWASPAESPRSRWLCCSPGTSPTPLLVLHHRPSSQKPQRPAQTCLETQRNTLNRPRWWDWCEELTVHHIITVINK